LQIEALYACSLEENSKQKNVLGPRKRNKERTHFCVGKKRKHLSESHNGSLISIPQNSQFFKKLFFAFSDRSYWDLSIKKFYEKRLIQSYERKTSLY